MVGGPHQDQPGFADWSSKTRTLFEDYRATYPLFMQASPVHLCNREGHKATAAVTDPARRHRVIVSGIQVGYHATAPDRLLEILDTGFEAGPNMCGDRAGVYFEPEATRKCVWCYMPFTHALPSRPHHLIGTALIVHVNPRFTRKNAPQGHQRIA